MNEDELSLSLEQRMLQEHPWLYAYVQHRECLERRLAAQWRLLVDLRQKLAHATAAGVEQWPEYKRLCELEPP